MLSLALCTFTLMEQLPTANEPLPKLILPAPAVAVVVPPQVLTTLGGLATTRPEGKVSVKLESIVTAFGLVMLKVKVLGELIGTVVGLKLFTMEGGCNTIISAVTVKPSTVASACPCPPVEPAL